MEVAWACLLLLAMLDRRARPLALVTASVGVLNYVACLNGLWRGPVAIDVLSGVIAARWVWGLPRARRMTFAAAIVIAPLVHAWHWLFWDAGSANDIVRYAYYTLLALLFSAKVIALSGPGVVNLVGIVCDFLVCLGRGLLDRLAPVPRLRPRPARW